MWTEAEISVEAFRKLYLYCPDKDASKLVAHLFNLPCRSSHNVTIFCLSLQQSNLRNDPKI